MITNMKFFFSAQNYFLSSKTASSSSSLKKTDLDGASPLSSDRPRSPPRESLPTSKLGNSEFLNDALTLANAALHSKETEEQSRRRPPPQVTLGIASRDATLVYYQISDGLLVPQRPLTAAQRLERDAKRKLGLKGGPSVKEARTWVSPAVSTEKTNSWGTRERYDALVSAQSQEISADETQGGKTEGLEAVDATEEKVGIECGGKEGEDSDCDKGGGGDDWKEDTEGFWD